MPSVGEGAAAGAGVGTALGGPWGTAIGAGVGALAGFGSELWTNAQNVRLNRENRDWQERMSNTAYQRAVADMRAAGLNPSLMFSHGGPESSPANTAPTVSNPMARGVQFATSAIDAINSSRQAAAQVAKTRAETATEMLRPDLVRGQTAGAAAAAMASRAQAGLSTAQAKKTEWETNRSEAEGTLWKWVKQAIDAGAEIDDRVMDFLHGVRIKSDPRGTTGTWGPPERRIGSEGQAPGGPESARRVYQNEQNFPGAFR